MALGLKAGMVEIVDHDPKWEENAVNTIKRLRSILGSAAIDIQHIGSTAIRHIKAKPVIDIAVLVRNFEEVLALTPALEKGGFIFRGWEGNEDRQPVFQCGEYIPEKKDMRLLTHYIHIVKAGSRQWDNYINFRDYMNEHPAVASEYETLKMRLEKKYKNDYSGYHKGKQDYISAIIKAANRWAGSNRFLG